PRRSPLRPYTTLFRSAFDVDGDAVCWHGTDVEVPSVGDAIFSLPPHPLFLARGTHRVEGGVGVEMIGDIMDVRGAVWCVASVAGELLDPSGAVVAVVVFVCCQDDGCDPCGSAASVAVCVLLFHESSCLFAVLGRGGTSTKEGEEHARKTGGAKKKIFYYFPVSFFLSLYRRGRQCSL